MEAMLDLATAHARERYQFGRPIGSFQAVRHRLAESRVAASGARSAARASFDEHEPVVAAMAAKVVAGRAFGKVAAHCQQVLAGVGFTADHPFHRFLFRGVVADRLFGSAAELAAELGRALVERVDPVRLAEL
jgi:alkylation response protein AidB-like acyl-CoA dehydrogenase